MEKSRNIWLDLVRILSIVMVMLYHFYCRHSELPTCTGAFSHGYLWVDMLFMVSGFFILDSLASVETFGCFLKKKLIRLTPALWICSLMTFLVFVCFDASILCPESHSFANFVVSILYVSPSLVNEVCSTNLEYINGSYWFLWVEILFYLIASAVYYLGKEHFIRNFFVFSAVMFFAYYIVVRVASNCLSTNKLNLPFDRALYENVLSWCSIFHYFKFSLFFLIGLLFRYMVSKERHPLTITVYSVVLVVMLLASKWWWKTDEMLFFLLFIIIWFVILFVLQPLKLGVPETAARFIGLLAAASYPMYLVHEQIGILAIDSLSPHFGAQTLLLPVLIILLVIAFCCLGYKYVERPVVNVLKRQML